MNVNRRSLFFVMGGITVAPALSAMQTKSVAEQAKPRETIEVVMARIAANVVDHLAAMPQASDAEKARVVQDILLLTLHEKGFVRVERVIEP